MRDLSVKVTKAFPGVEDGQVYPRMIQIGDVITGDLAAVFLKEKWGEEVGAEVEVKPPAAADDASKGGKDGQPSLLGDDGAGGGGAGGKADESAVEVPADWKTLKAPALKSLAEKIKGSDVADAAEAKTVIEAELARRAA